MQEALCFLAGVDVLCKDVKGAFSLGVVHKTSILLARRSIFGGVQSETVLPVVCMWFLFCRGRDSRVEALLLKGGGELIRSDITELFWIKEKRKS